MSKRATLRAGSGACPKCPHGTQSGVLGLGAYLVIHGEASAGVIVAGSILSARALAPVEQVIAHWKGFASARQSWTRLRELFAAFPEQADGLPLRKPASTLSVEAVSLAPPGDQRFVVNGSRLRSRAAVRWASSARARPASRRSPAPWSAYGGRCGAACGWMEPRSISGRPRRWAGTLAICPRTSSCSRAPLPRTSPASSPTLIPRRSSRAAEQAGVHELIVRLPHGLRDPHWRGRDGALGRATPASCARSRPLRRAVPGRSG